MFGGIRLHDMPQIAFGTAQGNLHVTLPLALSKGYRHIDCASIYHSGSPYYFDTIKESIRGKRSDIWITWKSDNITEEEIQRVIDLLECEYLDLFLIHHSCGSDHDFEVLKLCQSKGLITYYGVSNYEDITKIRELKEKHDIYANQIQARPPKGKIDGRRDLNPENFIDVCNSLLVKIMLFASISSIINSDEYINFYDHFDKVNKYYIDKYIRDKENVLIVSSVSGGTLDMNLQLISTPSLPIDELQDIEAKLSSIKLYYQ